MAYSPGAARALVTTTGRDYPGGTKPVVPVPPSIPSPAPSWQVLYSPPAGASCRTLLLPSSCPTPAPWMVAPDLPATGRRVRRTDILIVNSPAKTASTPRLGVLLTIISRIPGSFVSAPPTHPDADRLIPPRSSARGWGRFPPSPGLPTGNHPVQIHPRNGSTIGYPPARMHRARTTRPPRQPGPPDQERARISGEGPAPTCPQAQNTRMGGVSCTSGVQMAAQRAGMGGVGRARAGAKMSGICRDLPAQFFVTRSRLCLPDAAGWVGVSRLVGMWGVAVLVWGVGWPGVWDGSKGGCGVELTTPGHQGDGLLECPGMLVSILVWCPRSWSRPVAHWRELSSATLLRGGWVELDRPGYQGGRGCLAGWERAI